MKKAEDCQWHQSPRLRESTEQRLATDCLDVQKSPRDCCNPQPTLAAVFSPGCCKRGICHGFLHASLRCFIFLDNIDEDKYSLWSTIIKDLPEKGYHRFGHTQEREGYITITKGYSTPPPPKWSSENAVLCMARINNYHHNSNHNLCH